jgi:acyl-ACP thioesterase
MYSFESNVRFSECGSTTHLTIPALINYLQDCSTFHTESIGHGISWGKDHGFAWFIAAWQIQIDRLPRFTEHIRVSTWSYAHRPTLANRNFIIESGDGETLVRADSLWFPFDVVENRVRRIPEEEFDYIKDENVPVTLPPTRRKLKLQGDSRRLRPIEVVEHHLDSNNHVNNGQYVAMATNVVLTQDADFAPYRICAQYKNAAKLGDVVVPHLYVEEKGYAVDLVDEEGKSYAIVRMERR